MAGGGNMKGGGVLFLEKVMVGQKHFLKKVEGTKKILSLIGGREMI